MSPWPGSIVRLGVQVTADARSAMGTLRPSARTMPSATPTVPARPMPRCPNRTVVLIDASGALPVACHPPAPPRSARQHRDHRTTLILASDMWEALACRKCRTPAVGGGARSWGHGLGVGTPAGEILPISRRPLPAPAAQHSVHSLVPGLVHSRCAQWDRTRRRGHAAAGRKGGRRLSFARGRPPGCPRPGAAE